METSPSIPPRLLLLAVVVATGLLAGAALAEDQPAPVAPQKIAAKVNGRAITQSQVSIELAPKMARLVARFPDRGPEFEKLLLESRNVVQQTLVEQQILIGQFNQAKIEISPEAIEEEMQREIRDNYQGRAEGLRKALKRIRMTEDGFRDLLRDRLMAKEIQGRQAKKK